MPTRRLLHVFSTFKVGGPQRRFAQICGYLGGGYHHSIVSMDGRWDALDLLSDDIAAQRIDLPEGMGTGLTAIHSARKAIKEHAPDLLVTYNWGAIEWAAANLLPLCPHIHIEDGFRPDEVERRIWRRNLFRRLCLRSNSRVVVISQNLLTIALNEWKLPAKRVHFVPNGIDVQKFQNAQRSPLNFGISEGDTVIGTVAALRPEKDIAALIRVFARFSQDESLKLVICGDGPERAELESLAHALGVQKNVVFTGYTDKPEDVMPLIDVFALSSRTEQMPLSILEAMAAGLPVAGYNVGDVASMISSVNTPFIVERDEDNLFVALESLLSDEKLRAAIGKANFERANTEYTDQKMYKAYESLFRVDK